MVCWPYAGFTYKLVNIVEENMPRVLRITPRCGSAEPSDEWMMDGGRQVVKYETSRKVNNDELVVGDKCFLAS